MYRTAKSLELVEIEAYWLLYYFLLSLIAQNFDNTNQKLYI